MKHWRILKLGGVLEGKMDGCKRRDLFLRSYDVFMA
jgi:hypothetical protein